MLALELEIDISTVDTPQKWNGGGGGAFRWKFASESPWGLAAHASKRTIDMPRASMDGNNGCIYDTD